MLMRLVLSIFVLHVSLLINKAQHMNMVPTKHKEAILVENGPFCHHVGLSQFCAAGGPGDQLVQPGVENVYHRLVRVL